jgi:hypothetical protein
VEKWIVENIGAIIAACVATVIAVIKWLASKLFQRYEARMLAIETRQDHHETELDTTREKLDNKITRVEDKIDAHYRVIDSKIESILHHIITRRQNEREGDKNGHS